MSEAWTILRVLEWTTGRFQRAGIESARLDAQVLLAHTLGCDRVALYTQYDKPLRPEELAAYRARIAARLDGRPVAYLVGEQEFWSLPLYIDEAVLIPRPDTETVIEVVLDLCDHRYGDRAPRRQILHLATGSGAIAVTLAHELPAATVVATDVSDAALALCTRNAARNQVEARVEVRKSDLWQAIAPDERFDVAVSNPPYVRTADIAALSPEVRCEPRLALDGGPDGLRVLEPLIAGAPAHIRAGGALVLEHGHDQADAVARLIADTGAFEPAETRRDLGDNPRVTWARRK
jgi:release factor glutamine methyltransferase